MRIASNARRSCQPRSPDGPASADSRDAAIAPGLPRVRPRAFSSLSLLLAPAEGMICVSKISFVSSCRAKVCLAAAELASPVLQQPDRLIWAAYSENVPTEVFLRGCIPTHPSFLPSWPASQLAGLESRQPPPARLGRAAQRLRVSATSSDYRLIIVFLIGEDIPKIKSRYNVENKY